MTVQEGLEAPHFALYDQYGALVQLDDFDGCWVLVWWLPSTLVEHASGCGDRIAAQFAHHADQAEGLAVLGLSFDTAEQSRDFSRRASITFPMLTSDVRTAKLYGVYRGAEDEWNCFPRKRAFLVDPDGRIAKVYLNIDPDYFVHEVLADLDDLAHRPGLLSRALAVLRG